MVDAPHRSFTSRITHCSLPNVNSIHQHLSNFCTIKFVLLLHVTVFMFFIFLFSRFSSLITSLICFNHNPSPKNSNCYPSSLPPNS